MLSLLSVTALLFSLKFVIVMIDSWVRCEEPTRVRRTLLFLSPKILECGREKEEEKKNVLSIIIVHTYAAFERVTVRTYEREVDKMWMDSSSLEDR